MKNKINKPRLASFHTTAWGEPQKQRTKMEQILSEIMSGLQPESSGGSQVMCFVDLGLPSGVLWAAYDVETPSVEGCSLPTYEQAAELITCCDFYVAEGLDGTPRMVARGPSGRTIGFPLREYDGTPGPSGCCWCAGEPGSDYGYFLLLSEITITVGVGCGDLQFPYRLVRAQ